MKLSDHFTLEELTASQNASRLGIDNTPADLHLLNIKSALVPGLERLRALLGSPVIITSGYRSPHLNANTPGSSNTSAHTFGYAADFICPGFGDPWAVCNKIAMSDLIFDQVIYEYGAWTHISFDPRARRLLTTKLTGQPYREGLHKE